MEIAGVLARCKHWITWNNRYLNIYIWWYRFRTVGYRMSWKEMLSFMDLQRRGGKAMLIYHVLMLLSGHDVGYREIAHLLYFGFILLSTKDCFHSLDLVCASLSSINLFKMEIAILPSLRKTSIHKILKTLAILQNPQNACHPTNGVTMVTIYQIRNRKTFRETFVL